MKISFSKCPNSLRRLSFALANRSATSIKERLSTISVCGFRERVVSFLTHCWSKPSFDSSLHRKRTFRCGWCRPLVSTIRMMVQIFFIIRHFSSSMFWDALQISRNSTGIDCLKIAGMRWSSLLTDYDRNLHGNWILKLSILLMNQLC